MSRFTINGAFPSQSESFVLGSMQSWAYNLSDGQGFGVPAAAQWSKGAQLIVPVAFQPTVTQQWRIRGYTISALGAMLLGTNTSGAVPSNPAPYGALGKLYGGLVAGSYPPGLALFTALPQDLSNIALMWDGSQDPALQHFPQPQLVAGGPNQIASGSPLQASQDLASPIDVDPSGQLNIGLWLTPSLMYAVLGLVVANATYTILVESA